MKRKTLFSLPGVLCCFMAAMLFQPISIAKGPAATSVAASETITGTVFGVGGRFGGRTLPFRLIIDRYTSPEGVQQLTAAMQSGNQDDLLRVLSRMNAGRIQVGNNIGVTANAIIANPQEDGTKITVLYQRNVRFFELRYGTRSQDYRIGYAEIYLRQRNNSEGTFIPAARVRLRDGNTWEVEDFGEFPARLTGLRFYGNRPR